MVDTTGFVTALVINGALALVFITLFIVWRGKYPWCFDTRRDPKRRIIGTEPPPLPPGWFAWLPKVLQMTDMQVLSTAGLDALMFIKFFELCFFLFLLLSLLGIGILLPVNWTADGGIIDAFDKMSMANVPSGSRRFWAHLVIGYLFSFAFYYLCFHMWTSYMNLRHQFLAKWTLLGGNHTIMIHNLPEELRSDSALLAYMKKCFPGQVRSARMAKDLRMEVAKTDEEKKAGGNLLEDLPQNVEYRDAQVAALEHDVAAWEKQQSDPKLAKDDKKRNARAQVATKALICGKVDALDHHYSELERLNALIAGKQTAMNGPIPKVLMTGFVTFHSARTAIAASKAFVFDTIPYSFEAKMAPELRDVYWPSLNFTHSERSHGTVLYNVATGALVVFWMIPMGILMGVSNLTALSEKYSWLSGVQSIPSVVLGFIEAYLPAIMLIVFFAVLPMILLAFSKGQGIEAQSWLQKSVIHKYYTFMVINFFFGAIVGGAIFSNISALLSDINGVPKVLGQQIPTVANYFVNYVALAAFAGFPIQLSQVGRLVVGGIKKKYLALTAREFEMIEAAPAMDYGVAYCPHLFIFLIAMTYSLISPIIIPFAACYFLLGWLVNKIQLVHVFVQSFESGGSFWPVVYSKMSSSLMIAQICLVGILGLKEVAAPAALVVPLPIMTILFDRYIHNAIKAKLHTLPLLQLVEIDGIRKAERITRDKALGKLGAGSDGEEDEEVEARAKAKSMALQQHESGVSSSSQAATAPPSLAPGEKRDAGAPHHASQASMSSALPKSDLQYESRVEATPRTIESVVIHTSPKVIEPDEQNGATQGTGSYLPQGHERNQSSLRSSMIGPNSQALGFPYAPTEQDRAFVEGDVPAYIQPELTPAVPAHVEVNRAKQYLSSNVGQAAARVGEHHASASAAPAASSSSSVPAPAENMA